MKLRRFNESGIEKFRENLSAMREGKTSEIEESLLDNDSFSTEISGGPSLDRSVFETKRQAADLLQNALGPLNIPDLMNDVGLWSWLGCLFFDSICPPPAGGKRKLRADAHYILNPDYRRVYRHLLRTPFYISEVIPQFNRIFLEQPVSVHGELIEQVVGGRLYVIRIPSVAEAVDRLYYDARAGKPRRGFTAESRRGNLRSRLPVRIQQLSLTHDISGMTADQLIAKLGDEFSGWASGASQ